MVVTLGALLGDVPHTRAVRVTGTASDPELDQRARAQRSQYEGPTGIVGVLHDACRASGLRSASLWAPVPHYVVDAAEPAGHARAARALRSARRARRSTCTASTSSSTCGGCRSTTRSATTTRSPATCASSRAASTPKTPSERGIVLGGHPAGGGSVPDADDLAAEVEQFLREQDDGS